MKYPTILALSSILASSACLTPSEDAPKITVTESPFKSGSAALEGLSAEEIAAIEAEYNDTEIDAETPSDSVFNEAVPKLNEVYVFTTPERWANRDTTPLMIEGVMPFLWPVFVIKAVWWLPDEIVDLFRRLDEASWVFTAADLGTTSLEIRGTLEGLMPMGTTGKTKLEICSRKTSADSWSCAKQPSIKRGTRYRIDYSTAFSALVPSSIWGYRRTWKTTLAADRQYMVKLRYRLECNADAYFWNEGHKDCMTKAPAVTLEFASAQ